MPAEATGAPPLTRATEPAPHPPRRRPAAPPALRLVGPSRWARRIGRLLTFGLLLLPIGLALIPWRQSVSGSGKVVALNPLERSFHVDAPIYGRIDEWYVGEGTRVEQGQPIARVEDVDGEYLPMLQAQVELVDDQLELAHLGVAAYEEVLSQATTTLDRQVESAAAGLAQAEQKIVESRRKRDAVEVKRTTYWNKYQRTRRLFESGATSRQEAEFAERDYLESSANLLEAEAAVKGAESDRDAYAAKIEEVKAKGASEVEKARAGVQAARAKVAEADAKLQEAKSKVRRQESQTVLAPRSGVVQRLLVNAQIEQVKVGDPIAILVPEATELAVEMYLSGNDTPLVRPGDPVRLQFEGWPAVQFVGWPSVAVGTFAGRVKLIDPIDENPGKFRILVVDDPAADPKWPGRRYLRQGVRTKGWVLLQEVRLGYEVWRRLNGFNPVVAEEEPADGGKDSGKGGKDDKPKVKRPK